MYSFTNIMPRCTHSAILADLCSYSYLCRIPTFFPGFSAFFIKNAYEYEENSASFP